MSTWWFLECTEHDPPIRSESEVEQHTDGLAKIRGVVADRGNFDASSFTGWDGVTASGYFRANAVRFLIQHPKCRLEFVSEYGDRRSVEETEVGRD